MNFYEKILNTGVLFQYNANNQCMHRHLQILTSVLGEILVIKARREAFQAFKRQKNVEMSQKRRFFGTMLVPGLGGTLCAHFMELKACLS